MSNHTPGPWKPRQQTNGTWIAERINAMAAVSIETMRDSRGGLVFKTEAEVRAAIAKATGEQT